MTVPTVEEVHRLYKIAEEADDAWTAEIRKKFPREHVGDVRYTERGKGDFGTSLRAAHDRFVETITKWREAVSARRGD